MKLGLIPARGGSKGIARKNLAELGGVPLIAHTIRAARASTLERVLVSSDDAEILEIAAAHGAEPLRRPPELATDTAGAVGVMRHALESLAAGGAEAVAALAYLQPTSPFRKAEDIDTGLRTFVETQADVVVSIVEVPHNFAPQSLMRLADGLLEPLVRGAERLSRQDKPRLFARNGPAVLIVAPAHLQSGNNLYSGRVAPLVMPRERSLDIDEPFDLEFARRLWPAAAD